MIVFGRRQYGRRRADSYGRRRPNAEEQIIDDDAATPPTGPVRVGLVGLGSIGRTHARAIRALGHRARVVAVSGGSPEQQAAECPGAVALSPDGVIAHDRVELVVIASPAGSHAGLIAAAVAAGREVVVEKPLATDLAEAEALVAAAERAGVTVSVMAQRRLEPMHRALAGALHAGRLGRVVLGEVFVHWHRDDAYYDAAAWRRRDGEGAGSLPNQGLHSLDLLLWLLGPVRSVTAQQATLGHDLPFEDTTVATLAFTSGALGVVVTTTAAPPGRPAELALYTDRGSVLIEHDRIVRWEISGVDRPGPTDEGAPGSGFADPAAIGMAGHVAQWRDILDARREGRPPAITAADGLATVGVIDAIERAAATGTTIGVS